MCENHFFYTDTSHPTVFLTLKKSMIKIKHRILFHNPDIHNHAADNDVVDNDDCSNYSSSSYFHSILDYLSVDDDDDGDDG